MKIGKLILLITTLLYYIESIAVSSKLKKEQSNSNEYLKSLNLMNTNMEIYSNLFL